MAYIVDQFNQPFVPAENTGSDSNIIYMEQLNDGMARRRQNPSNDIFYDECVNTRLQKEKNYFFHARIKKLNTEQIFNIYLVNYDNEEDNRTQFLKTITVDADRSVETWFDFYICFSPLIDFNCILFELKRIDLDYVIATRRYPVICYEELSFINNMIDSQIEVGARLMKIGIQSRPGLINCINSEEIHVGKTGFYEIKNGIITVNFLSMINIAIEDPDGNNPIRHPGTQEILTLQEYLNYLASLSDNPDTTNSSCIFGKSKKRSIDSFSLDYMYKKDEEE